MAKIIYDDGSERDFNEEDFISRDELSENYISKEDLEENYVSKEMYDKKKKQAKEAFKQKDLAQRASSEEEKAELERTIEEKVSFKSKHWFDEIPEEILSVRERHPDLSWEEAYRVSDYHEVSASNPNPWRERVWNIDKKEISLNDLADLAETNPTLYDEYARKIESWEMKQID